MLTRSGKLVNYEGNSLPSNLLNGCVPKLSQRRSKQLQRAEHKWTTTLPSLIKTLRQKLFKNRTRRRALRRKLKKYYPITTIETLESQVKAEKDYSKQLATDLRNLWDHNRCDALTNLPDEMMAVVFGHLGYNHQQRLIRVSLRWKYIITSLLDHIHLHTDVFDRECSTGFGSKNFDGELMRIRSDDQLRASAWKYHCPAVQRISCSTDFPTDTICYSNSTPHIVGLMSAWADRYPNLAAINFAATLLDIDSIDALENLAKRHSNVTITIQDACIFALPTNFFSYSADYNELQCAVENAYRNSEFPLGKFDGTILDRAVADFCPFPTMKWTNVTKFRAAMDRAVWPYDTDEQVEWLSRHSPNLPEAVLREVFALIQAQFSHMHDARYPNQLCEEHDRLCRHLSASFYREKLDGKVRNLLVALIRYFEISSDDLPERCEVVTRRRR